MAQPQRSASTQGTPRSKRDLARMNNYYQYQLEINAARRPQHTPLRSKVVKNKIRGKSNDRISEEHRNPEASDTVSVYRKDFTPKQKGQERPSSQGIFERRASANERPATAARQNLNRSVGFIPGELNDSVSHHQAE